ncbi:MAG: DUF3305 domain-containing protein [Acidiferrobacterales bacterium]|nr:DUF3305 domain-containing protein [Acidiferrobacterales bacterium]
MTFNLTIVVECHTKTFNGWPSVQWELTTILSDPEGPASLDGPHPIHTSDKISQYMWKGVQLRLHLDAAEGYWYNFLSEIPYAFVVFETDTVDDDSVPMPIFATVSQDEAGAHLETDCLVLSAALPTDVRDKIEQYIVENYVPQTKKKRKRKNWFEEANQPRPNRTTE